MAKISPAFCLSPWNLSEVEFESNNPMNLSKEMSRNHSILIDSSVVITAHIWPNLQKIQEQRSRIEKMLQCAVWLEKEHASYWGQRGCS